MRLKNTLTLENFWDGLKEEHPEKFKVFTAWIDQYKMAIGYDKLFAAGVKFHHLPYALQLGIWFEFVRQNFSFGHTITLEDYDLRTDIENYFKYSMEWI